MTVQGGVRVNPGIPTSTVSDVGVVFGKTLQDGTGIFSIPTSVGTRGSVLWSREIPAAGASPAPPTTTTASGATATQPQDSPAQRPYRSLVQSATRHVASRAARASDDRAATITMDLTEPAATTGSSRGPETIQEGIAHLGRRLQQTSAVRLNSTANVVSQSLAFYTTGAQRFLLPAADGAAALLSLPLSVTGTVSLQSQLLIDSLSTLVHSGTLLTS